MSHWLWSATLSALGLIGLHLASRQSYWGAIVGLIDEAVWIAYAVATQQWSFLITALAYAWVYAQGLRHRRTGRPAHLRDHNDHRRPAPTRRNMHDRDSQ